MNELTPTQIKRKKMVQGKISETTGALGLTALGGTLLATKKGSGATKAAFKAVNRPRPAFLKPKNLKRKTGPLLATSAGIGGIGSFNFASYTKAEGQKKIRKSYETESVMEPTYGEEGIAKNWSATGSIYSPEYNRDKRAKRYQVGAATAAGGMAAGGAQQLHQGAKSYTAAQQARGGTRAAKMGMSRKATGRGMLLGVGALAAGGGAAAIQRKRKSTWQPYAKRDSVSAFGVDHTDVTDDRN